MWTIQRWELGSNVINIASQICLLFQLKRSHLPERPLLVEELLESSSLDDSFANNAMKTIQSISNTNATISKIFSICVFIANLLFFGDLCNRVSSWENSPSPEVSNFRLKSATCLSVAIPINEVPGSPVAFDVYWWVRSQFHEAV